MKLSSRKQLLKEAEEELEAIKKENRLNESETNFLIDRLQRDTSTFNKLEKRYQEMINLSGKTTVSVPITTKVPVSVYYDIEHDEVRYDISEGGGDDTLLEKEIMKSPQFKNEMKKYSDMAKLFMKDCGVWIKETAKKSGITISKDEVEDIMWNLF